MHTHSADSSRIYGLNRTSASPSAKSSLGWKNGTTGHRNGQAPIKNLRRARPTRAAAASSPNRAEDPQSPHRPHLLRNGGPQTRNHGCPEDPTILFLFY